MGYLKLALTLSVATLFICTSLPALAEYNEGTPECKKLLHDGNDLKRAGKMTEALQTYAAAAKADPLSSAPASHIASLYLVASTMTEPDLVDEYRNRARAAATEALEMDPTDFYAEEVIRELDNGEIVQRHTPKPDAYAEFQLAENAFRKKQYEEAIIHYQKAVALDPQYDVAYTYMGDCYFATERYPEAEANYRHAVELNPMNSQAWRFLADALIHQSKFDTVPQVLANGIAAVPNDMPSWDHLDAFYKSYDSPMQRLELQRHASYDPAKKSVNVDPNITSNAEALVFWLGYGAAQANSKETSAFGKEFAGWESACKIIDEQASKDKEVPKDPTLAQLYRFYKDGQLKPAIFVLAYREAWRADFEAWKKDNPNGVKAFIDTYHVRP